MGDRAWGLVRNLKQSDMASSQKVEETLNRINTHMGVLGVIIVNKKGVAIKSTMK